MTADRRDRLDRAYGLTMQDLRAFVDRVCTPAIGARWQTRALQALDAVRYWQGNARPTLDDRALLALVARVWPLRFGAALDEGDREQIWLLHTGLAHRDVWPAFTAEEEYALLKAATQTLLAIEAASALALESLALESLAEITARTAPAVEQPPKGASRHVGDERRPGVAGRLVATLLGKRNAPRVAAATAYLHELVDSLPGERIPPAIILRIERLRRLTAFARSVHDALPVPLDRGSARDVDALWRRIGDAAGGRFVRANGEAFRYRVVEGAIVPWQPNIRIDREAVERACARLPIEDVRALRDLPAPSYLHALLTDKRIRRNAW